MSIDRMRKPSVQVENSIMNKFVLIIAKQALIIFFVFENRLCLERFFVAYNMIFDYVVLF